MSNGLLYHAFGIRGYAYRGTRYEGGGMIIQIEQPREKLRCSACGSAHVFSQGQVRRTFRSLPIGFRPVSIEFPVPRVRCRDCGVVRQVKIAFADSKRRSTKRFERYVLSPVELRHRQSRGPSSGRQLGHDSRHRKAAFGKALPQAEAEEAQADCHR